MFVHPWIHRRLADDRRAGLASTAGRRTLTADAPSARAKQHVAGRPTHFAHRESDGLTVDLYWEHGPHHDAFRVEVVDRRGQRRLTLHPTTGRAALDAFYHPFAYAA